MRGLRLRDEAVHPLSYFLTPCWSSGALNLGSMVESLGSFQKLWLPGPTLRFRLNWLEVLPGCPQLILVKSKKCCTDSNVSLTRVIIWQQGPWVLAWALATSTWSKGNLLSSSVSLWQSHMHRIHPLVTALSWLQTGYRQLSLALITFSPHAA